MFQAIKTIAAIVVVAIVVMTAGATAVQQDAGGAAFDIVGPSRPMPYAYLPELPSYGYAAGATLAGAALYELTSYEPTSQSMSYGESFQLKSNLDPSPFASLDDPKPFTSFTEPTKLHKGASLGHSQKFKPYESPRQLQVPVVRIKFNSPALPPMASTLFCLKYQNDCRTHKTAFRGGAVKLTAERWTELKRVNAEVNRSIIPERNNDGLAGEKWVISPKSGDCNDYAVTKRHELLKRGWPARALLLSEVVVSWGEHHLVLVVRTSDGDFVADNLNANIRSWSKTPYQWVRIQSPDNPTFWSTVASTTVLAKRSKLTDARNRNWFARLVPCAIARPRIIATFISTAVANKLASQKASSAKKMTQLAPAVE